ncbi:phospholipid-binding lipoprotein MlaA [Bathymodiolus platifrons methanotrophic gill symbiont]|uniref:MlaA family lipoprotein n=2 Tax=Bathymodiolus platifrons methanotrophic gill symbiont TaxID=113268 RepID=UPI000B420CAB|nr:VacJ family lipoprotein [Bathymodiolus platifrons methanotrophic gill symbiont]TXL13324.1 ABC transporter [Methylococcaceae bacterium HT4]TXL18972.1 ABC transporter [Methylococcaceae bacterium HT5]GAW85464.1 phospholipid-binding lipoprotein MlaA [Bathymodiolus platifrons methanotrophic gill symbiont]GFO77466.1 phospholipid-binding lipoprotein MlaA [Bathymodiolus platifrons methanotrophic gill symbiont]
MIIRLFLRFIAIAGIFLLVACASTGKTEMAEEVNPEDLHEGINRNIYGFNKGLDTYVSSPLVGVYQFILPSFLRTSVANFFANLKEPRTVVNDALQGKEQPAGEDFERFVINTLLGFGGLIDVASYAEIEYHEEDFSQTLAVWGVPQGEYLVVPVLGPTTYRGVPGLVVDAASSPVSYLIWPIQVLDLLNSRSNADQSLKFIDEAAVDPYVFMRASYLQWRDYQITEGKNTSEIILLDGLDDPFDDEDDLDLLDDLEIKL